jgi:RHS repeat-associated protein
VQTFGVNNRNQLTNATRSGTLTVAGLASQPGANLDHVAVSGTGLSSGNADVYADGSWVRAGATLADGNNSYTATAEDNDGRTASDSISLSLPATITFQYDGNGNLTNDGRRVFEYDYENQLTNVYVASAWKSVFQYDAFGRRRVRKEYGWQSSAWVLTNEMRYVYDGMLVVQERDANNLALVSYTRGADLSGSRQGAGGIGGLLARTDHSTLNSQPSTAHSYYHSDGNGNITALVDTNGFIVAKYQYDPYGNLLGMAGPLAEANTYRFSSKQWHANAGLYYYGFRYYEPNLQRWLNRDPIGESGGLNLFAFLENSPNNLVDPWGQSSSNPGGTAGSCTPEYWEIMKWLAEEAIEHVTGIPIPLSAKGLAKNTTKEAIDVARRKAQQAAASKLTGQVHHALSKYVSKALDRHPTLKGKYKSRDNRFRTKAKDKASHNGYDAWQRKCEKQIENWLDDHKNATPEEFEEFLRLRYSQSDALERFPMGPDWLLPGIK